MRIQGEFELLNIKEEKPVIIDVGPWTYLAGLKRQLISSKRFKSQELMIKYIR